MKVRSISKKEDIIEFLELLDGKNLNFLIGAGASMPYLKGLQLGTSLSFEDLYECARVQNDKEALELLSKYFYINSLKDGTYSSIEKNLSIECKEVQKSYFRFIQNLTRILYRRSVTVPKRVNLFTTNYDMFFEYSFDNFIRDTPLAYYNDGSYGFIKKYISTERFHIRIDRIGVDGNFSQELPMFNLIKLHGSLNWKIDPTNQKVMIDNNLLNHIDLLDEEIEKINTIFYSTSEMNNSDTYLTELKERAKANDIDYSSDDCTKLLNSMTIVLPTKQKFYATVFEDHYYQSLRILTQELERKQTVLIVFGFSFADEHIKSLIKRSQNSELQILIICFDENSFKAMSKEFSKDLNVELIKNDFLLSNEKGDFRFLNALLGDFPND